MEWLLEIGVISIVFILLKISVQLSALGKSLDRQHDEKMGR